jgi:DNA-binding transcriptional LysR family regulator
VPERAIRLFGEEVVVVCSRSLLRDRSRPLKRPHDLKHHVLLHFDYAGAQFLDWGTWLTSLGIGDLKPAGALHFSQYEQMIQAAISGQGVALGRQPLVNDLLQSGALVTPFRKAVVGSRAYFIIESEHGAAKPHVRQFATWLMEEAKGTTQPQGLPNSS